MKKGNGKWYDYRVGGGGILWRIKKGIGPKVHIVRLDLVRKRASSSLETKGEETGVGVILGDFEM